MIFLFISFIAGMLTVITPCVLPMIPVIIGGSVSEGINYRKAYTVVGALGLSVFIFTLLLKVSTVFISVPPAFWEILSGCIIALIGVFMIVPDLWDRIGLVEILNRRSNQALSAGYRRRSFWGNVIMGASLGPVFTSCSPTYFIVLATVLPQNAAVGILDLVAYSLGLCFTMLFISLLGQRILARVGVVANPYGWFRKGVGLLLVLVGIAVFSGLDKSIETKLASHGFGAIEVEQHLLLNTSS